MSGGLQNRAARVRISLSLPTLKERNMSEKFVYLAGPVSGLSYEGCVDWREYAKAELSQVGITALNPLRAKDYLKNETSMPDSVGQLAYEHPLSHVLSSRKGITTRDRWDCMRSDVVIANMIGAEKASIGTAMEIAWADSKRIPVILVEVEGGIHDHAMIHECAGFIVPTLDEALAVAKALLQD